MNISVFFHGCIRRFFHTTILCGLIFGGVFAKTNKAMAKTATGAKPGKKSLQKRTPAKRLAVTIRTVDPAKKDGMGNPIEIKGLPIVLTDGKGAKISRKDKKGRPLTLLTPLRITLSTATYTADVKIPTPQNGAKLPYRDASHSFVIPADVKAQSISINLTAEDAAAPTAEASQSNGQSQSPAKISSVDPKNVATLIVKTNSPYRLEGVCALDGIEVLCDALFSTEGFPVEASKQHTFSISKGNYTIDHTVAMKLQPNQTHVINFSVPGSLAIKTATGEKLSAVTLKIDEGKTENISLPYQNFNMDPAQRVQVLVKKDGFEPYITLVAIHPLETTTVIVPVKESNDQFENICSFCGTNRGYLRPTLDLGTGYPYYIQGRFILGIVEKNWFRLDVGAEVRSFVWDTTAGAVVNGQFFNSKWFSFGTHFFIGGGGGSANSVNPVGRTNFAFEGMGVGTLKVLDRFYLSLQAGYQNFYENLQKEGESNLATTGHRGVVGVTAEISLSKTVNVYASLLSAFGTGRPGYTAAYNLTGFRQINDGNPDLQGRVGFTIKLPTLGRRR